MGILRSVSDAKDNTYVLKRVYWNDVSEDWPFYTEEERQQFKRRKPQNLTPPGSDGGVSVSSIGSGHSSSSSHPASPQPTVSTSTSNMPVSGNGRGDFRGVDQRKGSHHKGIHSSSPLKRASPPAVSNFGSPNSGSERSLHQQLQSGLPPSKKIRVSNYRRPADMQLAVSPPSNSGSYSDSGGRSPAFIGSMGRSPRHVISAHNNGAQNPSSSFARNISERNSPSSAIGGLITNNDNLIPSSETKASQWLLSNGNSLASPIIHIGNESPHHSPLPSTITFTGMQTYFFN